MMQKIPRRRHLLFAFSAAGLASVLVGTAMAAPSLADGTFLGPLHTITPIASTVPANGDVNPYGVAVVPRSTGRLHRGDVLVSNFNNAANLQGTGRTIVEVAPNGSVTTFATINPAKLPGACPGGVGLTTALSVLRSGWVIVGSLPTKDGTSATAANGCLLVLDSHGKVRETFSGGPLRGPWDMASIDNGRSAQLFVSNVLNGTLAAGGKVVHRGTVVRINLRIGERGLPRATSMTVVGSGFGERTDPAALVIGPTGLAVGNRGSVYVADTVGNRITVINRATTRTFSAGTGRVVTKGGRLNGPLGLTITPGQELLSVNSGDGRIVETTPSGQQVASRVLDSSGMPPGAGALFGLALTPHATGVYFVDDATNSLLLLH